MLKTLLGRTAEDIPDHRDDFQQYIIASSYKKMNSRFGNKDISERYYKCLEDLPTFSFLTVPFDKEKADSDQPLAIAILSLAAVAKMNIPNLERAAKARPLEIYNQTTYVEFHLLLCDLLFRFKTSLENLQVSNNVLKDLKNVATFGYYLRVMVRSYAIEIHLQTIAKFLAVDDKKKWTPRLEEDADFPDFDSLRTYSMRKGKQLLPWESYRDWLMLMVHYFDSADVLTSHVGKVKPDTISITILSPQLPDTKMLPWTKVLKTERFFRTVPGKTTGKEFIAFFESTPMVDDDIIKDTIDYGEELKKKLNSNPPPKLDKDYELLAEDVRDCGLGRDVCDDLKQIREKVLELKGVKLDNQSAELQKVLDMLIVFKKRAWFSKQLRKGSLTTGQNPPGTYHCEAFLASFLSLWEDSSGEGSSRQRVLDFGERLVTIPAKDSDIGKITEVVDKMKACHVSMHRLKLY
jgi:hypothetical protein